MLVLKRARISNNIELIFPEVTLILPQLNYIKVCFTALMAVTNSVNYCHIGHYLTSPSRFKSCLGVKSRMEEPSLLHGIDLSSLAAMDYGRQRKIFVGVLRKDAHKIFDFLIPLDLLPI